MGTVVRRQGEPRWAMGGEAMNEGAFVVSRPRGAGRPRHVVAIGLLVLGRPGTGSYGRLLRPPSFRRGECKWGKARRYLDPLPGTDAGLMTVENDGSDTG